MSPPIRAEISRHAAELGHDTTTRSHFPADIKTTSATKQMGHSHIFIDSLPPKWVPAGTKNSRSEDFLLAKHKSHKHPHHDEPFSI